MFVVIGVDVVVFVVVATLIDAHSIAVSISLSCICVPLSWSLQSSVVAGSRAATVITETAVLSRSCCCCQRCFFCSR